MGVGFRGRRDAAPLVALRGCRRRRHSRAHQRTVRSIARAPRFVGARPRLADTRDVAGAGRSVAGYGCRRQLSADAAGPGRRGIVAAAAVSARRRAGIAASVIVIRVDGEVGGVAAGGRAAVALACGVVEHGVVGAVAHGAWRGRGFGRARRVRRAARRLSMRRSDCSSDSWNVCCASWNAFCASTKACWASASVRRASASVVGVMGIGGASASAATWLRSASHVVVWE